MKNNAKRLLSILLAALLCVGMIVPAFATDADHDHEETVCTTKHIAENGTEVETKAPVCGNYGYTIYTCNDCGEHFLDNIVKPTGTHEVDFDTVLVEAVEATCTTAGTAAGYACKNCDSMVDAEANTVTAADLVIEALGHDIEGVTPEIVDGLEKYECKRCGELVDGEQVSCPEGEHVWGERPTAITPAVRNEDGTTVDGEATYTCSECGATKKVVVIWNHYCEDNLVHVEAVEPEHCEAEGNIEYWYCELCGIMYADEAATKVVTEVENNGKHSYDEEPIYVAPTCTTYGFTFYACTKCGVVDEARTIKHDKLPHTAAEGVDTGASDATCTKDGYTGGFTCTVCGTVVEGEVIEALGHDEVTVTVGATCHSFGYTFTYCANPDCDEYTVKTVYTDETGDYDVTVEVLDEEGKTVVDADGNVVKVGVNLIEVVVDVEAGLDADAHVEYTETIREATCDKAGLKYTFCKYCSDWSVPETIPALGHDFDATIEENVTVTVEGNCTTDKLGTVKCSRCDATTEEQVLVKADGHNSKDAEQVEVDATCAANGFKGYICVDCKELVVTGEIEYEAPDYYTTFEAAAAQHNISADDFIIDRDGNCTLIGLKRYECADCGDKVLVVLEGTGSHDIDETVTEVETEDGKYTLVGASDATCTEDGYTGDFYCNICGLNKGTVIEAAGHNYVDVEGKDATCTEDGYTAGSVCDKCGDVESATEVVPALGHDWVKGEDGVYACSRCDATCDHANAVVFDKYATPDCDDYGFVYYSCDCGYEWIQDYAAELGHTDGEAVVVDPTCTENGSSKVYCTVCGELTAEEVIPATGHQNEAGETIVESCDDETEDRFCVNCETEISKDCTDVTTSVVAPTCGEYGYVIVICNVCGKNKVEIDDTLEPTEKHVWKDLTEDDIIVTATPTAPGTAKHTCSVCGFEDVLEYTVAGTAFNVTVENNIVAGSDYVVGSKVKVTVTLDTSKIDVWGLKLDLVYTGAKFEKAVIGETFANATGKFGTTVVNNTNAIALLATANNTAENKMQNVELEGSIAVIELYFEITSASATFTAMGELISEDKTAIEAGPGGKTIVAGKLFAENAPTLEELNTVMALFTDDYYVGEGEDAELVEYLTAADYNLNGAIDVEDVKAIMTAILTGKIS